jgi:hypothetical protein
MSGNNAFNKSMNGIVSLDTGGTTIEGEIITTDTINCQTINATTANLSPTINTSQIFTDFIATAANPFISILGDVKYNNNLYVDNIYANLGTTVNINNTLKTTRFDSVDPTSAMNVLASHTGIINMGGSASVFRLGSITTPVRCAYVAVASTDLCNKDYVDSVSGSSLLSATNVWTGASNTFNNDITASMVGSSTGDFQNPTATGTCRFARNTTSGTVTLANSQTTGILNIATQTGRTGAINIGAITSTTTNNGILNCNDGTSIYTVWGKASIVFTGGVDYNIVSGNINNIFMVVVNGVNPRSIQMPARKIGQIIIIRSIASVSNSISVSLISGGNFYNPGQTTTALFYSLPPGGTVNYFDNGSNWISF